MAEDDFERSLHASERKLVENDCVNAHVMASEMPEPYIPSFGEFQYLQTQESAWFHTIKGQKLLLIHQTDDLLWFACPYLLGDDVKREVPYSFLTTNEYFVFPVLIFQPCISTPSTYKCSDYMIFQREFGYRYNITFRNDEHRREFNTRAERKGQRAACIIRSASVVGDCVTPEPGALARAIDNRTKFNQMVEEYRRNQPCCVVL